MKSADEIARILSAYDRTGSHRGAARLTGCSHRTVAQYVQRRAEVAAEHRGRSSIIDPYLAQLRELLRGPGYYVSSRKAHDLIAALGFTGSERTTRRALARLRTAELAAAGLAVGAES